MGHGEDAGNATFSSFLNFALSQSVRVSPKGKYSLDWQRMDLAGKRGQPFFG